MLPQPLANARRLVLAHGWNSTAYQILNPGIELWFARGDDAVVGFVRHGRTRVVAGAPVCASERLPAVAAEFEAEAGARRERVCYFAAEARLESMARAAGPYARVLLGAQPVWRPAAMLANIDRHASLRAQLHRARNKGVTVAEWPADVAEHHPELLRCLAEWLATRGLPPLHFLVEPQTLERVLDRRVFVASRDGVPTAFLMVTPIPQRRGWLVEQIVRGRDACNGTSELMLTVAARTLAADGAELLSLGLAPLAQPGAPTDDRPAWWLRATFGWLRAHGRRFYDFRGLEAFKTKFGPERWEPVFGLVTTPRVTPAVLYAIAGAFSRGSPVLLGVRALARAVLSEARRFLRLVRPGRRPEVAAAISREWPR
jgi:phosphatidylglycerol lysyltransferase